VFVGVLTEFSLSLINKFKGLIKGRLTLYCLKVGEGEGIRKQTSRAKQEQEQTSNRARAEQSRQATTPTTPPEKRQKFPIKKTKSTKSNNPPHPLSLHLLSSYHL